MQNTSTSNRANPLPRYFFVIRSYTRFPINNLRLLFNTSPYCLPPQRLYLSFSSAPSHSDSSAHVLYVLPPLNLSHESSTAMSALIPKATLRDNIKPFTKPTPANDQGILHAAIGMRTSPSNIYILNLHTVSKYHLSFCS